MEHDFNTERMCSCGTRLKNCEFWAKLAGNTNESGFAESLQFQLSDKGKPEYLDRRGRTFRENMGIVLGFPLNWIYRKAEIERYREKNENFFLAVRKAYPQYEFIIDCSKSSERLSALLPSTKYEIWCVYLKRSAWAQAASRIKRVRKREIRSGFFVSLKFLFWQKRRNARFEKTFKLVPKNRRLSVSWENFVTDPIYSLTDVRELLGLDQKGLNGSIKYRIRTDQQHVYVGNRWLFRDSNKEVELELRDDIATLSRSQKLAVRLVYGKQPQ